MPGIPRPSTLGFATQWAVGATSRVKVGSAPVASQERIGIDPRSWEFSGGNRVSASLAAPSGVTWNSEESVYATMTDLLRVSVCLNNGRWIATVGARRFLVYQDDAGFVQVVQQSETAGAWTEVVRFATSTGSADGFTSGRPEECVAMPCIAAASVLNEVQVVVAYRFDDNGSPGLYVEHSADGYQVATLAESGASWGVEQASNPCVAMDTDGYSYVVFTGLRSDGESVIYLSVRPPEGGWTTPVDIHRPYDDPARYPYMESAGFASVAACARSKSVEARVSIAYRATVFEPCDGVPGGGENVEYVTVATMDRTDLEAAEWDMSDASHTSLSDNARDPCAAMTVDGVVVVAYVDATPGKAPRVFVAWNADPENAEDWESQEIFEVDEDAAPDLVVTRGGKKDFPSVWVDDSSGLCLLVWEDFADATGSPQIPYGAVAGLADLTTWTPLGNVTTGSAGTDQGQYPCIMAVQGEPMVTWVWGVEQVSAEIVARSGEWTTT